jgi:hypothetical protein
MKKIFEQAKKWVLASSLVLLVFSCNKNPDRSPIVEREITLSNFNKIAAGEKFNVVITRGNAINVKVKGPTDTVNDIEWNVANSILNITFTHYSSSHARVDVYITLPELVQLNLSGAASGTINGFQGVNHVIRTVISGAAQCMVIGTGLNTQVDISGAAELTLSGTTSSLYGNISGSGRLHASELAADEVDIATSGSAQARVKVVNSLFVDASGTSTVYYLGNPNIKHVVTSGTGRVIKQL